jgi:hypothetical protein
MQIAISLLMAAMSLLTQVANTPNVSPEFRLMAENVASQAVSLANQIIADNQAEVATTTEVATQPLTQQSEPIIIPPVFGSTLSTNQPIMETQLDCTLTAESNVGTPSSLIKLTWTSNADSAQIKNSKVYSTFTPLEPATGGTKSFQLSSELGENNIFTARFTLKEQTKDCTVSVLTQ